MKYSSLKRIAFAWAFTAITIWILILSSCRATNLHKNEEKQFHDSTASVKTNIEAKAVENSVSFTIDTNNVTTKIEATFNNETAPDWGDPFTYVTVPARPSTDSLPLYKNDSQIVVIKSDGSIVFNKPPKTLSVTKTDKSKKIAGSQSTKSSEWKGDQENVTDVHSKTETKQVEVKKKPGNSISGILWSLSVVVILILILIYIIRRYALPKLD